MLKTEKRVKSTFIDLFLTLIIISALELKLQLRRPMTALVEQGIMPQYKVNIWIKKKTYLNENSALKYIH